MVDAGTLDVSSAIPKTTVLRTTGGVVEINADVTVEGLNQNGLYYKRFQSGANYWLNGNYSAVAGGVFTGTTANTAMQYAATNSTWLNGVQTGPLFFNQNAGDRPYGVVAPPGAGTFVPQMWPGKTAYSDDNDFGYLFTGYLSVPAGKGGQWGFNRDWVDDRGLVAIDLNGDGDFTDANENGGEWGDLNTVTLQENVRYAVAYSTYEWGGGDHNTFRFYRVGDPTYGAWTVINPSDPNQAGLWGTDPTSGLYVAGGQINVNPGNTLKSALTEITAGTLNVLGTGAGGTFDANILRVSGTGTLTIGATLGGDPGTLVMRGNLIQQNGSATGNTINLNGTFSPDGTGTIQMQGGTAWAPLLATFNSGIDVGNGTTQRWGLDLGGFGVKYNANWAGSTGHGTINVRNNAILNLNIAGALPADGVVNLTDVGSAIAGSAGELRLGVDGGMAPGASVTSSGRYFINVMAEQTTGVVPYLSIGDKAAIGGNLTGFTIDSASGGSDAKHVFLQDGAIYAGTVGAAPTEATQGVGTLEPRQLWRGITGAATGMPDTGMAGTYTVGTDGAATGFYGKGVAVGNWTYPDGNQTTAFTGTIQQVAGAVDGNVEVLLNNGYALTLNAPTLNLNTPAGNKYIFNEVGNLKLLGPLNAASSAKTFDVNGLASRQNADVLTLQSGSAIIRTGETWTVTNGRIATASSSTDGLIQNQAILNVASGATLHMDRYLNSGYINIQAGGAIRVHNQDCMNNIGQVTTVGSPDLLNPAALPDSTINIDVNAPADQYPLMIVTEALNGGNAAKMPVAIKNMNIMNARTNTGDIRFNGTDRMYLGNNRYMMSPQGTFQNLNDWEGVYPITDGSSGNLYNIGLAKFGADNDGTRLQFENRNINPDNKQYVNVTFGSHTPLMGIASVSDYSRVTEIPTGRIQLWNAHVNSGVGTVVANVWSGHVRRGNVGSDAGLTWNVEGINYGGTNYPAILEAADNYANMFNLETVNVRNLGILRAYYWRDWGTPNNNRLTGGTYNFYDGSKLQFLTNHDNATPQTATFDAAGTTFYTIMPGQSATFESGVSWNSGDTTIARLAAPVTMKAGSKLTISTIDNRSMTIDNIDATDGDVEIGRTGGLSAGFTTPNYVNGNQAVIGTLTTVPGRTLSFSSDTAVNYPITINNFAGGADFATFPGSIKVVAGAPLLNLVPTAGAVTINQNIETSGTGTFVVRGGGTLNVLGEVINGGAMGSTGAATIGVSGSSLNVPSGIVRSTGSWNPGAGSTITLGLTISPTGVDPVHLKVGGPGTLILPAAVPQASNMNVTVNNGVLDFGSASRPASTLTMNGGSLINGSITAGVLDIRAGTIGVSLLGTAALNKTTPGTATLNGNNSGFGGAINITEGTLQLGFTPVAGAALWLDSTKASTMTLGAGNTVTQWRDASGNGASVNQSPDGNVGAPVLLAGGANTINNLPVVNFTTDRLINYTNYPAGITVFSVARYTGGANNRLISSTNNNWILGYHGGWVDRGFFEGWVAGDPNPTHAADTDPHMYEAIIRGTGQNSDVYVADAGRPTVTLLASNQGGTQGLNGLALGGWQAGNNESSNGQVGEILIYNGVLSASDRTQIESYLISKWLGGGAALDTIPDTAPVNIGVNGTLAVSASETIGQLVGTGTVQLNQGGILTINCVDQLGNPQNSIFGGMIQGDGGLTKAGSADLGLAAQNDLTGDMRIKEGRLILTNPLALHKATLNIVTGDTGVLDSTGISTLTLGGLSGNGSWTMPANVTVQVGNNNLDRVFSGTLGGDATLKKIGTGTQILTGANAHTGTTSPLQYPTIVEAGTLQIGQFGNPAVGSVQGAIQLAGGTLALSNGGHAGLKGEYISFGNFPDINGQTLTQFNGYVAANTNQGTAYSSDLAVGVPGRATFDFGAPFPQVGQTDNFVVRWTGLFNAPTTGTYTFWGGSDDRNRLWLDGVETAVMGDDTRRNGFPNRRLSPDRGRHAGMGRRREHLDGCSRCREAPDSESRTRC